MYQFLIITLVCVTFIIPQCDGNCIWYGVCYPSEDDIEDGALALNCADTKPGRPLDDKDEKSQKTMQRLCPDLFTNCMQPNDLK